MCYDETIDVSRFANLAMTDGISLVTVTSESLVSHGPPASTGVYDPVQLQTVIDRLETALRAATALAGHVEEISDATAREVIELRIVVGRAVAAVMAFQPRCCISLSTAEARR